MSPALLSVIAVSTLTALAGGYYALRRASHEARLRKVAVVAVEALRAGDQPVRVIGTVRAIDEARVAGPYSGTPGLAVLYERWEKSGGQRFRRLDRQLRHTPFVVDDGGGSVAVALDHVELALELAPTTLAVSGPNRVFGAGVIAANQGSGLYDHLEGVVKPGDRVAVIGRVELGPSGPRLTGTPAAPLVITNYPALVGP